MSTAMNQYIFRESAVNFITNTFFNGLIAWLLLRGGPDLTMWGKHNFAFDLMATAFILLFIVTVIVIPLQRRKVRRGDISSIQWDPTSSLQRLLQRFPVSPWRSGILFGLIGLLLITPLTLLLLTVLGVNQFSPDSYAAFKGVWAGMLAAVMMGPMILLGLANNS